MTQNQVGLLHSAVKYKNWQNHTHSAFSCSRQESGLSQARGD